MGLLDSVVGALGQGQGGGQPDLMQLVLGLLGNDASGGGLGGLGGLLARAQQGGLGDIVQSWIGTGQNLPVAPEQLQAMLGPDTLGRLAQQLGLSTGDAAGQLSQLLPQVVDQLTPQGRLPEGGLGDVGALLSGFLKR
jgi:uncharacterized protein YidB (DUF937 family)